MKVACVQMDIRFGNPEENFLQVEKRIREAASLGGEIIVLPEMWNTAYALNELDELADKEGRKTKQLLTKLAKELHVHIIGGSVSTKRGESYYNTMYVVNKEGEVISQYDKAHLFNLMNEHLFLEAGNEKNLFSIQGAQMAGVICYDLRFPEWFRTHALAGAKVIFVPAQWPSKRVDHWRTLLQARAIENQCYIVAVNRVGEDPDNEYNGHSMVVSPWGEVLWTAIDTEEIGIVELDMSVIEDIRKRMSVFQDRREELYQ